MAVGAATEAATDMGMHGVGQATDCRPLRPVCATRQARTTETVGCVRRISLGVVITRLLSRNSASIRQSSDFYSLLSAVSSTFGIRPVM